MYDELVKALRYCVLTNPCELCPYYSVDGPTEKCSTMNAAAADAIESLKHTVEILCGAKINLVRCCECVYHDDESQYHYCRKWRRNCPNDSDFFCKWGKRNEGGWDEC